MLDAKRIRTARERANYTQETLALAAGVSRRTIQKIEAGATPSAETARALMSVLDIAPSSTAPTDEEAEIQTLMDYWIDPETPWNEQEKAYRLGIGGFWATVATSAITLVTIVLVALGTLPETVVVKAVMILPVISSLAWMTGARRIQGLRTGSDVDNERAAFRERLLKDGVEKWRIPEGAVR